MSELVAKDLRAVLDIVYMLNDDVGDIDMPTQVLAQLGSLVGCDVASYSRVQHVVGELLAAFVDLIDMDQSGIPEFHAVFNQHPGFTAYRSGRLNRGLPAALHLLPAGMRSPG